MVSTEEAASDVIELCAILQCLGFAVKSMDSADVNLSQDHGIRTVELNCQSSGLHVVLEASSGVCSCPAPSADDSSFWQVSGVAGGKQRDKETGTNLLNSIPPSFTARASKELRELVRCVREFGDNHAAAREVEPAERSASAPEINTTPPPLPTTARPDQLKPDTPTRYRSLDALTSVKEQVEPSLPNPGALVKHTPVGNTSDDVMHMDPAIQKIMCRRQSTYTIASTPGSASGRRRNKTSSPIQEPPHSTIMESLLVAEKAAEDLRNKICTIIKEINEDRLDSSMSSLALDVSKISVLKGNDFRNQFASSPNLSSFGTVRESSARKPVLKRLASASTSNISSRLKKPEGDAKEDTKSRLRKLSPNFFKRKESPNVSKDKSAKKSEESRTGLTRSRIVTPVRVPKIDGSPNISSCNNKRFSHIKSTIPRLSSVKKE